MNPIPSVSAILICDRVIEEAGTGKKTLVGIFERAHAPQVPALVPFAIYARLTDAEGDYRFRINISFLRSDREEVIGQLSAEIRNVQARLGVLEVGLNLPPWPFPSFGRYEVQLYANDIYIAHTAIDVIQIGGQQERNA